MGKRFLAMHTPERTDMALRLVRVLTVARIAAAGRSGLEAYAIRLAEVRMRAFRRWLRRYERAPGLLAPADGEAPLAPELVAQVQQQVAARLNQPGRLRWVQVSSKLWQIYPTLNQPWAADVYQIADGWGAAGQNELTRESFGTVGTTFPTDEAARAAIDERIRNGRA